MAIPNGGSAGKSVELLLLSLSLCHVAIAVHTWGRKLFLLWRMATGKGGITGNAAGNKHDMKGDVPAGVRKCQKMLVRRC